MILLQEQTFSQLFYGELSISEWKFHALLISLGVIFRILLKVATREEENTLSISHWINDIRNWASFFMTIILGYFLIRFFGDYSEKLTSFIPEGINASVYLIIAGLGFFMHKIAWWLSKLLTNSKTE